MTYIATITSKRQLTIPADLFSFFGLKQGQKVIVTSQDGKLVIEPALNKVESLAGSVMLPKRFQGLTMDEIIHQAKKDHFTRQ